MKIIFEEYGDVILVVIVAMAVLGVVFDLIWSGGALNQLISTLASNAC